MRTKVTPGNATSGFEREHSGASPNLIEQRLIHILGLRTYYSSSENREKTYDAFHERKWRAKSVAEIYENPESFLAQIPQEEQYNLFFTCAYCEERKGRIFFEQSVIPFDIDKIDLGRRKEYVEIILDLLKIKFGETGILCSGNGLQFMIELRTRISSVKYFEEHRKFYRAICKKIDQALKDAGLPGQADPSVFSPARLMRFPLTKNVKKGKPERFAELINRTIVPVEFDLVCISGLHQNNEMAMSGSENSTKYPKPDTQAVLEGCEVLKECGANPQNVTEPLWYAALSIWARLENGRELAHQYSSGHAGYTYGETEDKIDQALESSGPRTCENFKQLSDACNKCKHFGKVKSPILIRGPDYARARLGDIQCLGLSGSNYFYSSLTNPQINQIREHSEMDLLKLRPLEEWRESYGKVSAKGIVSVDWTQAKSDMTSLCRKRGIFDNRRVLGRGVWQDEGMVVVHLGDRLYYGGKEHPISCPPSGSKNMYEFSRRIELGSNEPLSLVELAPFVELLSLFSYSRPEQRYFLGGFLATASVCGALAWRSHIWLMGESGSGKSTVQERLIKPILGAFEYIFAQGGTTEAGLRQSLRGDAIPVIFDEFEADTKKSSARVENCLELMRQASSDGAGQIIKGSVSGEAQKYCARFQAIVSSVKPKLVCDADRARFTPIELRKEMGSPEKWERLDSSLGIITQEFAARFFARMLQMVPVIRDNQKKFQRAFAERHSQRFGQQYGTLLAGWAALISDSTLEDQVVLHLVNSVKIQEESAGSNETDQLGCLQYLLNKRLRLDVNAVTVLELVQKKEDFHRQELLRHGMTLVWPRKEDGEFLFVAGTGHPELAAIFRESKWADSWDIALGRLPGAVRGYQVRLKGQHLPRGVLIPMSLVVEDPADPEKLDF